MGIVWNPGAVCQGFLPVYFRCMEASSSEGVAAGRRTAGFQGLERRFSGVWTQAGREACGRVSFKGPAFAEATAGKQDVAVRVHVLWRGLGAGLDFLFDPVERDRAGDEPAPALRAFGDVEPGEAQDFFCGGFLRFVFIVFRGHLHAE